MIASYFVCRNLFVSVRLFLSGWLVLARVSVDEWRERSVESSFEACMRVARCNDLLPEPESRVLCALSSWNAFDVEPNRASVRRVSGVPESRFYSAMRSLEEAGSVSCSDSGPFATCQFVRCPGPVFQSALSGRRGIVVTHRGRVSPPVVPAGSEHLFRGMTGVERDNLLRMVQERMPASWDFAAFLDNIDPSLSYAENKEILEKILPSRPVSEAELKSMEERAKASREGWL